MMSCNLLFLLSSLLLRTRCSLVLPMMATLYKMPQEKLVKAMLYIAKLIGVIIGLFGIKVEEFSIFILSTIACNSCLIIIAEYIKKSYTLKQNLFYIFEYQIFEEFYYCFTKDKHMVLFGFLCISLIIGGIFSANLADCWEFLYLLIGVYLYREIFHSETLISLGIEYNTNIFVGAFTVLMMFMFILDKKYQKYFLAAIFSIVGPLLIFTSMQLLKYNDFGLENIIKNWASVTKIDVISCLNYPILLGFAVCFIVQLIIMKSSNKNSGVNRFLSVKILMP